MRDLFQRPQTFFLAKDGGGQFFTVGQTVCRAVGKLAQYFTDDVWLFIDLMRDQIAGKDIVSPLGDEPRDGGFSRSRSRP